MTGITQGDGLTISSGMNMGGLEAYVSDACEALRFRLLKTPQDIEEPENEGLEFEPGMTHQIYGDNENIFGYQDLKIDFLISASTLKAFVDINYSKKIDKDKTDGVEADPVLEPLLKILAEGQVLGSKQELATHMASDKVTKFKPLGNKIDEFKSNEESFEIYHVDCTTVPSFRDYHAKLQPFLLFFIDAASYIDIDDSNWRFFLVYEKYSLEGETRYSIAGFATVYQYYAYPANIRPRVSQVLTLPPYQKKGQGSHLLNAIYKHYFKDERVVDITVEDPSEDFVRLRDFVDTKNCLKSVESFGSLEAVSNGFTDAMASEANKKLKLCKRQARRVYEILRLHYVQKAGGLTDRNQAYKDYRVAVKKRLNKPFQAEERKLAKLKKVLKPEEFEAATAGNITDRSQKLDSLQSQYKELEEHYLHVLERIDCY